MSFGNSPNSPNLYNPSATALKYSDVESLGVGGVSSFSSAGSSSSDSSASTPASFNNSSSDVTSISGNSLFKDSSSPSIGYIISTLSNIVSKKSNSSSGIFLLV